LLGVLWLLHRTRVPVISSAGQADPQGSVAERS
ncbi:MAG TPA: dolichol-phosphate mannosyltransferase, partial [Marinobacter adhaerens]|nr:dolichol-phosphate mannosyltransferase [Marinobacter adhaerens]